MLIFQIQRARWPHPEVSFVYEPALAAYPAADPGLVVGSFTASRGDLGGVLRPESRVNPHRDYVAELAA